MGNCALLGREAHVWDDKEASKELVTICARHAESDRLSRWLTDSLVPFVHRMGAYRLVKPNTADVESGIRIHADDSLLAVANTITTVLASLLPTVCTIVLYFSPSTLTSLGLIVVFTFLFSFILAVATDARRVEIFAATAAFAAVEVVFVGATGNSVAISATGQRG
ncbi:MAG: hypothetical protein M1838_002218 [Thelocarpon superellum]|nr:MAG: hypothetical protein M1838_002218 [Thelocarpon superellum]